MNRETLNWAVFVAVLAPLFLRMPADPIWMTALHVVVCMMLVSVADRIERRG
ncbi:hypothetical protein [Devosia sp. 2618]|uniref:hypothetical protein n=1 Tax=Devosia sp. 2618 TaxID=3156454 RepID=UPI0033972EC1